MTYCCGILVRDGLVMIADTRTNAGLDNISVFRKLHVFSVPGERIIAIASAGNLSLTQSVLSMLHEGLENPETGERETLIDAPTMFQAAQRLGRAIRALHRMEGAALEAADVKFDLSFLLGGQIKSGRLRLFMMYSAGNFIECTHDTPYFQIGEHKYGKPVLDRAVTHDIDLYDALKISLISVDQPQRGHADRHSCGSAQRPHGGSGVSDRAGRAVLHRPAPALVGGAAGGPCRYPAPALRDGAIGGRRPSLVLTPPG